MSPKDESDGFTFASCKELWKTQEEKVLLERSMCDCDEAKQLGHTKLVGTGRAKHETQRTILLTTMRYQVSLPTDCGTSFCTLVHNSLIEEAFVAIGFD
jgi:hypothetical protein